ncbi:MAG: hypothetical protein M3O34_12760 [Chloroflexota bacterium]|nr:hypothetical protein [Chloroflexota bacterium]
MTDVSADRRALLHALAAAFERGDAPRGETLLARALDAGIPWDQVTTAAADGMTRRYGGQTRPEPVA